MVLVFSSPRSTKPVAPDNPTADYVESPAAAGGLLEYEEEGAQRTQTCHFGLPPAIDHISDTVRPP